MDNFVFVPCVLPDHSDDDEAIDEPTVEATEPTTGDNSSAQLLEPEGKDEQAIEIAPFTHVPLVLDQSENSDSEDVPDVSRFSLDVSNSLGASNTDVDLTIPPTTLVTPTTKRTKRPSRVSRRSVTRSKGTPPELDGREEKYSNGTVAIFGVVRQLASLPLEWAIVFESAKHKNWKLRKQVRSKIAYKSKASSRTTQVGVLVAFIRVLLASLNSWQVVVYVEMLGLRVVMCNLCSIRIRI